MKRKQGEYFLGMPKSADIFGYGWYNGLFFWYIWYTVFFFYEHQMLGQAYVANKFQSTPQHPAPPGILRNGKNM